MGNYAWSGQDGAGGIVVGADGRGPRPAVLLTTAIAGVNDYVIREAQRLASAVLGDMADAVEWLRQQPFAVADRIGVLGFCIGGTYALLAASRISGLRCAVTFYGMLRYKQTTASKPHSPLASAVGVACPVLGHFGEEDHLVPVADARELGNRLLGKPAEICTYPGAGHAFHEDFRPQVYRPVAATTAWARTQEYFSYYLMEAA